VREGRRIAGEYRITRDDVLAGRRHEDAVARVTFGFDVHALSRLDTGYISATMRAMHDKSQPYDVSYLKGGYGLRRSRLRGDQGQQIWTGWAILTYNLDTLAIHTT
jgi:hypothetical protein